MTSLLDEQVQGRDGILDVFRTRRIEQGVGEQWVTIRADFAHDKVRKTEHPGLRNINLWLSEVKSFVGLAFGFGENNSKS